MDEFEKTAEQSELSGSQGNDDADVSQREASENNEMEFSEENATESRGAKLSDKPWKTEENKKNAQRRREQRDREVREKAIIEAIGGINPFTGEEVKDAADVEEYLLMRKIEKEGGDPISDFAKHHKTEAKRIAAEREKEENERAWYARDREDFATRYPDVDLSALIKDEGFSLFAQGKVGEIPLADIYEGFIRLRGEYEQRAKDMAAQYYANSKASPGSLSSPETASSDFLSCEDVKKMSREEIRKNYDKIRASMPKW